MAEQEVPAPLVTLRGDMKAVNCVAFQLWPRYEYLYTATQAGVIHKWNLKSCREEYKIEVSKEGCLAVKYMHPYFILQTKGGNYEIWEDDVDSGYGWKRISKFSLDYCGFCKFDIFSVEDSLFVCPESDSKVRVVSLDGKTAKVYTPTGEDKCGEVMAVKCIALSGVKCVFVLYESGVLILFEVSGERARLKVTSDCPMCMDFDGVSKGVIGSSGDVIVGFELTSDLRLVDWKKSSALTNPGVGSIRIRPDRKLVAAGCWDSRIRLFSMKSLQLLVVLISHREAIQDICYSPVRVESLNTEWLLAAAGQDGRVTLWNLY